MQYDIASPTSESHSALRIRHFEHHSPDLTSCQTRRCVAAACAHELRYSFARFIAQAEAIALEALYYIDFTIQ